MFWLIIVIVLIVVFGVIWIILDPVDEDEGLF